MNHQIESDLVFDLQVEHMDSIRLPPIPTMTVDMVAWMVYNMVVTIEILNNRVKNPSF